MILNQAGVTVFLTKDSRIVDFCKFKKFSSKIQILPHPCFQFVLFVVPHQNFLHMKRKQINEN